MRVLFAALLLSLFALQPTLARDGHDRRVQIVNQGKEPIYYLRGSNQDDPSFGDDKLGDDVIMPGDSATIDFDDGTGYCMFDLEAEFKSGREETDFGVNVCEVSRVSFR